jgi:hypothetical protein
VEEAAQIPRPFCRLDRARPAGEDFRSLRRDLDHSARSTSGVGLAATEVVVLNAKAAGAC